MQNKRGFVGTGVLIAILIGVTLFGGGAYYVAQQQLAQAPTENFDNLQQLPTTNNQPQATQQQLTDAVRTSPAKTYSYETSTTLSSFKSPSGTYAVRFDNHSQSKFRIVELSTGKVLSDYKPKMGSAVICELVCYAFAQWLNDTKLIIGSYSLVNNEWNSTNPAKRHDVVVFDVLTETYRPATQSEIAQFDLYNNTHLTWESPTLNTGVIKIISPNGGEVIKLGSTARITWEGKNVPSGAELELELFEITSDKTSVSAEGACLNCTGSGLRSGVPSVYPVANGTGSADWVAGKLYSGGYVNPGSRYIIKAKITKSGTVDAGECPQGSFKGGTCAILYEVDWSDAAFSLTN